MIPMAMNAHSTRRRVDSVAEPADGSPASMWDARSSIRLKSEEPMPRPGARGGRPPEMPSVPSRSRGTSPYRLCERNAEVVRVSHSCSPGVTVEEPGQAEAVWLETLIRPGG